MCLSFLYILFFGFSFSISQCSFYSFSVPLLLLRIILLSGRNLLGCYVHRNVTCVLIGNLIRNLDHDCGCLTVFSASALIVLKESKQVLGFLNTGIYKLEKCFYYFIIGKGRELIIAFCRSLDHGCGIAVSINSLTSSIKFLTICKESRSLLNTGINGFFVSFRSDLFCKSLTLRTLFSLLFLFGHLSLVSSLNILGFLNRAILGFFLFLVGFFLRTVLLYQRVSFINTGVLSLFCFLGRFPAIFTFLCRSARLKRAVLGHGLRLCYVPLRVLSHNGVFLIVCRHVGHSSRTSEIKVSFTSERNDRWHSSTHK